MAAWLSDLAESAGPLLPAAQRFAAERSIASDARGARAAGALARAIDHFCHSPETDDPTEDDRFIEGAGAFLALMLLDTFGGAGHVRRGTDHRVRIGEHGYFDPFGAVDAALDADDPLASLEGSLALAEAEARGTGPVSAALLAFEAALAAARPDLIVDRAASFVLDLRLADGTEIDLSRLASAPDAGTRHAMAERLVSMLPGSRASQRPQPIAERILPRLVGAAFLAGIPPEAALATYDALPSLTVAFVELHPGRARFLRASEIEAFGGMDALKAVSLDNLSSRPPPRLVARELEGGVLLEARTGDGLDAARLLLEETFALARRTLPDVAIVTAPHRDTALFAREEDRGALLRASRDLVARAPHPIAETPHEIAALIAALSASRRPR